MNQCMFPPRGIEKLSTNPLNDRTSNIDQMIRHKKSTNRRPGCQLWDSSKTTFTQVERQSSNRRPGFHEQRFSGLHSCCQQPPLYKGIFYILVVFCHSKCKYFAHKIILVSCVRHHQDEIENLTNLQRRATALQTFGTFFSSIRSSTSNTLRSYYQTKKVFEYFKEEIGNLGNSKASHLMDDALDAITHWTL